MKKLLVVFFLLVGGICFMHAQDVIVLLNGDEIEAKVLEISSSEIRYKNYNNQDGPTIVIAKSEVQAINYENGTSEIISTAGSGTRQRASTEDWNPNRVNFGIFVNPVGLLQFGPLAGFSLSANKFLTNLHVRIPQAGLLFPIINMEYRYKVRVTKGIGVGLDANYFSNGPRGGFFIGGMGEFWTMTLDYKYDGPSMYSYHSDNIGGVVTAHGGYRWRWPSGFFLNVGGYAGATFYNWKSSYLNQGNTDDDVMFFGMVEVSFGFNFIK